MTFDRWQSAISSILHAEDEDGLERCNEMKAPIVDLLSAVESVTADVGRSLKALKTARDEEAAQKKVRKAASSATGDFQSEFVHEGCAGSWGGHRRGDLLRPWQAHPHRGRQRQVGRWFRKRAERQKRDPDTIHAAVPRAQGAAQKLDRAQKRFRAGSDVQSRIAARSHEQLWMRTFQVP